MPCLWDGTGGAEARAQPLLAHVPEGHPALPQTRPTRHPEVLAQPAEFAAGQGPPKHTRLCKTPRELQGWLMATCF